MDDNKLDRTVGTVAAKAGKEKPKTLMFNPGAEGLKDGVFNTFRLGKDWAERVAIGDVIDAQVEGVEDTHKFEVTGVISGNWDNVGKLAVDNHATRNFAPGEAPSMLQGLLKSIYGDEMKANSVWTVLYLKPVE